MELIPAACPGIGCEGQNDATTEPHECPYQIDMGDVRDDYCFCCPQCVDACKDAI